MPNVRLVLEYDGAQFSGWQVQPGQRTVQEELRKALEVVCGAEISNPQASGRTDAGVHARRQVANVVLPEGVPSLFKIKHAVSNILKNEVAIVAADVVPDAFHSLRDSVAKQYSYHVFHRPAPPTFDHGYVHHVASPLNIELMQSEARALIGKHDFASFRASGCAAKTTVREIFACGFEFCAPYLVFTISGNGFLKQMVRNILGTLLDIGKGKLDSDIPSILGSLDRTQAGPTAPPHALFLDWVEYQDGFRSDRLSDQDSEATRS